MDPNENTKSGPEQEQLQSPALQDSASQADEPGNMKAESPRQCKICGGPNHYGCGCEAQQRKDHPNDVVSPESETPKPAPEVDDDLEDVLGTEAIRQAHESTLQMQKDIKTMAEGFESLCACFYDTNNYLKTIDATVGCICTVQGCIEQHLNTIHGMLKEVKERMDKDVAVKNQD